MSAAIPGPSTDPTPSPKPFIDSDVDDPDAINEAGDTDTVVRPKKRQKSVPPVFKFNTSAVHSSSKFKWHTRPQQITNKKTPSCNVIRFKPGPTAEARVADTPEKAFRLLFSDAILDEIVTWTNACIQLEAANYAKRTPVHSPVTYLELLSLLGILIFGGCQRDNHLSVEELWSPELGAPMYRAAMGQFRFEFLMRCLHFDDPATRLERRAADKFAPIRNIFDIFNDNCQKLYSPGENLTVGQQLLGFRGYDL